MISYNVLCDADAALHAAEYTVAVQPLEHRLRTLIIPALEGKVPHIVCLQDVPRDAHQMIVSNMAGLFKGEIGEQTGSTQHDFLTLYRGDLFKPRKSTLVGLSDDDPAQFMFAVEFLSLLTQKLALIVVNVRLSEDPKVQFNQARVLRKHIDPLFRQDAPGNVPVIVAGSFNCSPDDSAYGQMAAANGHFMSVFQQNEPVTRVRGHEKVPADYIFYNERIVSHPCDPPLHVDDEPLPNDHHGSDHLMLTATLQLPPPDAPVGPSSYLSD